MEQVKTILREKNLLAHVRHEIGIFMYGQDEPCSVSIECITCEIILIEFDDAYPDPYYGEEEDDIPF